MKDMLNLFKKTTKEDDFDHIKISLASADLMRSLSYGEVRKPKQLIIEHLSQREMVYFVRKSLVL